VTVWFSRVRIQTPPPHTHTHARARARARVGLFNCLDAELNPICHLLALLGAHHILHVSRIRVKGIGPIQCYILFCPVQGSTEYECVDPEDLLLVNLSEYKQPKGAE
jgi:hypothetical protein